MYLVAILVLVLVTSKTSFIVGDDLARDFKDFISAIVFYFRSELLTVMTIPFTVITDSISTVLSESSRETGI